METVAGKRVLITGAARGMGKLYAELAVKERAAAVVLWDIDQTELDKTVAQLRAAGGVMSPYVVNVSELQSITDAAVQVREEVGDIEILFNNAGVVRGKYFWEHDHVRDIWFTMSINALAPMYVAREFLPGMIDSKRECRIVNIASAAGTVSNPRMSVYCASKWSVIGWSDSLRLELEQAGHRHVAVTTVCPSYISTGMFDGVKAPRCVPMMTPEYVVEKVWAAMKAGKPFVLLPRMLILSKALKGLLPIRLWDFLAEKLFGVYTSMESFKGHQSEIARDGPSDVRA
jgi:short-subunit dehydrogenase